MTPAAKSFSTSITVRLVVCLKIHPAANSIVTLATITWRRPGGLILYCTVLFCTVLYKKRMKEEKIRKFADTQRTIRQSDNQTFQRLRPLSSSDYSRELANKFYSILFHSMTVTSSQISPMTLAMSVYLPSRPLTSLLRGCCSHNRE